MQILFYYLYIYDEFSLIRHRNTLKGILEASYYWEIILKYIGHEKSEFPKCDGSIIVNRGIFMIIQY